MRMRWTHVSQRRLLLVFQLLLILALPPRAAEAGGGGGAGGGSSAAAGARLQHPRGSSNGSAALQGFDPAASSTFEKLSGIYNIRYADGTLLRIARIQEDVFIGGLATRARLGLIVGREGDGARQQLENGGELSGVGGVLGLGFSDAVRSASIIKTLTAAARPSWNIEEGLIPCTNAAACRSKHMAGSGMAKRRFSFLAAGGELEGAGGGGELQLGGYDESACEGGEVKWSRMKNESGYGVAIKSITLGTAELLNFTEASQYKYTVGFLDTGATCLQIPSGLFPQGGGVDTYRSSPFGRLMSSEAHVAGGHDLKVTVEGMEAGEEIVLEIPHSTWGGGGGCTGGYAGDDIAILGTPLFRRYMVVFDMEGPQFRLGFCKTSKGYKFAEADPTPWDRGEGGVSKVPVVPVEEGAAEEGRGMKGMVGSLFERYAGRIGLGDPIQNMTVLVDTGSILLAVYNVGPPISQLQGQGETSAEGHSSIQQDTTTHPGVIVVAGSTATSHFAVADFGNDGGVRGARGWIAAVGGFVAAAGVFACCARVCRRRGSQKPKQQWQRIVTNPISGHFAGFGEGGHFAGGARGYQGYPHNYS